MNYILGYVSIGEKDFILWLLKQNLYIDVDC